MGIDSADGNGNNGTTHRQGSLRPIRPPPYLFEGSASGLSSLTDPKDRSYVPLPRTVTRYLLLCD